MVPVGHVPYEQNLYRSMLHTDLLQDSDRTMTEICLSVAVVSSVNYICNIVLPRDKFLHFTVVYR